MKDQIGVFDSGIGGLIVLEKLKEIFPNENFIYYKDSKNNPYGEKKEQELYSIVRDIVQYFIQLKIKLIVIACNTVTIKFIEKLKIDYPEVIFVGISPAINKAIEKNFKNTLVMGTPLTIDSKKIRETTENYNKSGNNIKLIPCPGLAHAIEENNKEKIRFILTQTLTEYKDQKIDSIVLGCTHYSLIKDEISNLIPNISFIDGIDEVVEEVNKQLILHKLKNTTTYNGETIILNSKDRKEYN